MDYSVKPKNWSKRLPHYVKKLISKKLEIVEKSLSGVLEVIFETEEQKEKE